MTINPCSWAGEANDNQTQQPVKEGMSETIQEHEWEINTLASTSAVFSFSPTSHQYLWVGSASDRAKSKNIFTTQTHMIRWLNAIITMREMMSEIPGLRVQLNCGRQFVCSRLYHLVDTVHCMSTCPPKNEYWWWGHGM